MLGLNFPGQAFGAGMARRERKAMRELEDDRKHNDTITILLLTSSVSAVAVLKQPNFK